jgi:hypothetical protein
MITAWVRFSAHDGDIGFFSDARAGNLLSAIQDKFEEIEDLYGKLSRLEKICEDFGKAVS